MPQSRYFRSQSPIPRKPVEFSKEKPGHGRAIKTLRFEGVYPLPIWIDEGESSRRAGLEVGGLADKWSSQLLDQS